MKRYGLRDDQFLRIENLLPGRPGTVGRSSDLGEVCTMSKNKRRAKAERIRCLSKLFFISNLEIYLHVNFGTHVCNDRLASAYSSTLA